MNRKKPRKNAKKKSVAKKATRYEDYSDVINEEIAKKRYKWNLSSLAWMDYEDVSQILRNFQGIAASRARVLRNY